MSNVKYFNPLSPEALFEAMREEQPKNFVLIYEGKDGLVHMSCNYLDRIKTFGLVAEVFCWLGSGEADATIRATAPSKDDTN